LPLTAHREYSAGCPTGNVNNAVVDANKRAGVRFYWPGGHIGNWLFRLKCEGAWYGTHCTGHGSGCYGAGDGGIVRIDFWPAKVSDGLPDFSGTTLHTIGPETAHIAYDRSRAKIGAAVGSNMQIFYWPADFDLAEGVYYALMQNTHGTPNSNFFSYNRTDVPGYTDNAGVLLPNFRNAWVPNDVQASLQIPGAIHGLYPVDVEVWCANGNSTVASDWKFATGTGDYFDTDPNSIDYARLPNFGWSAALADALPWHQRGMVYNYGAYAGAHIGQSLDAPGTSGTITEAAAFGPPGSHVGILHVKNVRTAEEQTTADLTMSGRKPARGALSGSGVDWIAGDEIRYWATGGGTNSIYECRADGPEAAFFGLGNTGTDFPHGIAAAAAGQNSNGNRPCIALLPDPWLTDAAPAPPTDTPAGPPAQPPKPAIIGVGNGYVDVGPGSPENAEADMYAYGIFVQVPGDATWRLAYPPTLPSNQLWAYNGDPWRITGYRNVPGDGSVISLVNDGTGYYFALVPYDSSLQNGPISIASDLATPHAPATGSSWEGTMAGIGWNSWWKLDEPTGATFNDSGSGNHDFGGSGSLALAQTGLPTVPADAALGLTGGALFSDDVYGMEGTQAFTVLMLLDPTTINGSSTYRLIVKGDGALVGLDSSIRTDAKLQFHRITTGGGFQSVISAAALSVTAEVWLALVRYSAANGLRLRMAKRGVAPASEVTTAGSAVIDSTAGYPFAFGAKSDTSGTRYAGVADEIAVKLAEISDANCDAIITAFNSSGTPAAAAPRRTLLGVGA
jgi:hypothetical protein